LCAAFPTRTGGVVCRPAAQTVPSTPASRRTSIRARRWRSTTRIHPGCEAPRRVALHKVVFHLFEQPFFRGRVVDGQCVAQLLEKFALLATQPRGDLDVDV